MLSTNCWSPVHSPIMRGVFKHCSFHPLLPLECTLHDQQSPILLNNLLYSSTISYTPQDLLSIQDLLNSSGSSISSWSPTSSGSPFSSGSSIASGSPKFFRISYLQILIKIWFSSAPHWVPLMLNRYVDMKQII